MPRLYIPAPLRTLTDGRQVFETGGATVAEALDEVERDCPGIRRRLVDPDTGRLTAGMSVSVDGAVAARGLLQPVAADSEIHFVPALGGG